MASDRLCEACVRETRQYCRLRDLALCLDLIRIIVHYETILAALQIARSLWIRAAVLRCRRTLAGAYDTSIPPTRDQKHQQVAN